MFSDAGVVHRTGQTGLWIVELWALQVQPCPFADKSSVRDVKLLIFLITFFMEFRSIRHSLTQQETQRLQGTDELMLAIGSYAVLWLS